MSSPRRRRFTMLVVVGCGVIVFVSLALSAITFVRQSQSATVRKAELQAQNTARVASCFQQVKDSPRVLTTLGLIDDLASTSIKNSEDAIKREPGSPLTPIRERTINMLTPKRDALRVLIDRTKTSIPKTSGCKELAARLGVDTTKLNK